MTTIGDGRISTRMTVCAVCGHRERLIVDTDAFVLSRCHACGDERRVARAVEHVVARRVAAQARPRRVGRATVTVR